MDEKPMRHELSTIKDANDCRGVPDVHDEQKMKALQSNVLKKAANKNRMRTSLDKVIKNGMTRSCPRREQRRPKGP